MRLGRVELFQQGGDDRVERRRVIDLRQQMRLEGLSGPPQHPTGMGQLPKMIMIVARVVLGLLERFERLAKRIAGRHLNRVHQLFGPRVQPVHALGDELFQA